MMWLKLTPQLLLTRRLVNALLTEIERKMLRTPVCSLMMYIGWRKRRGVQLSTNRKLKTELKCSDICLNMCMALSCLTSNQNSFNLMQCILLYTRLDFNICLVTYLVAMLVA
uniref:Translation initiation factor eIF-2B delta subunit n=1 Tax=Arundo donax TaxID=35708 RepID=A0A0A9FRI9_ARUDO